jgi:hypothetical protein
MICPKCKGSGKILIDPYDGTREVCGWCGGTGSIESFANKVKPDGDTWVGWAGRRFADGVLLLLAYKALAWMGLVVYVACGVQS